MCAQFLTLRIFVLASFSDAQIRVLIVDGQNNHAVWPKSTIMMKQYLEESDLFEVDIQRTKYTWKGEREKEGNAKKRERERKREEDRGRERRREKEREEGKEREREEKGKEETLSNRETERKRKRRKELR